ncbi:hypothetical protein HETIRDRAFT_119220 [Heterobasidion irregulare TC 32-1]|uniref:Uncharacterized protein n=1 Tax=Heterobasidion irregulare (strain TC 32-1) TaxID=747525 RepID=W4JQS9_HETIT|nr:uncharacterized protein HETIRDRAFT_119220 [Heterobasidion irregulare TC 32-1]ETW75917.1 hypothetical protein HETIRDRAFT_119220 [Heterobasidion irregulare TC 32-1]
MTNQIFTPAPPTLQVVLVLCLALRATSSISPHQDDPKKHHAKHPMSLQAVGMHKHDTSMNRKPAPRKKDSFKTPYSAKVQLAQENAPAAIVARPFYEVTATIAAAPVDVIAALSCEVATAVATLLGVAATIVTPVLTQQPPKLILKPLHEPGTPVLTLPVPTLILLSLKCTPPYLHPPFNKKGFVVKNILDRLSKLKFQFPRVKWMVEDMVESFPSTMMMSMSHNLKVLCRELTKATTRNNELEGKLVNMIGQMTDWKIEMETFKAKVKKGRE